MPVEELAIAYQFVNSLHPYAQNARTHTRRQIKMIAESIKAFGFTNPILTDENNTIVAGHGRLSAAQLLGIDRVPTIRLEKLSEDQIRAYILADNKLAEKAGWDESILAIELQHLMTVDLGFDVTITGFEVPEIDLILQRIESKPNKDDVVEEVSGPAVTSLGDVWLLGKHRLVCGNSLYEASFLKIMDGRQADAVFVDPPYNVAIDGHVSGNGAVRHREFEMASGEMTENEFFEFLCSSFGFLVRHSKPGSVHFACMDWRHAGEILAAGKRSYDSLLNLCVWAKDKGGMGSFYRSQHELVFVFRNGKASHRNNVQLGKFGRNRTNVWQYSGINTLSKQGEEGNLLALHPTVKPVALVADALLDCTRPGGLVLDSFLGSGSTLIAAERTGRVCYGIELDPLYVDTAIRRWHRLTGSTAIHAESGKKFEEATRG
ncbi:site-specific DNA-methyltransferase [Tunturiibacter gelidoferens]|uniref:DNA modification methylase n=1 Tax=Tunturiibacter gelidiferens TaxID=3069689 RepID=A0ACC5NTD6_9BACT|nr:DNA methyltransferase [Edaphobacter lichenicola]MBB5337846.1 DNA modification methylase [Edaphobacter lichenicola]